MASTAHWNVIAKEIVGDVVKDAKARGYNGGSIRFSMLNSNHSEFSIAIQEMVKTALVSEGFFPSNSGNEPLVVYLNGSGAQFGNNRYSSHIHWNADTQDSGGVKVVRNVNSDDRSRTASSDSPVFDNSAYASTLVPDNELVLTIGVYSVTDKHDVARRTNTYYLSEKGQYERKNSNSLPIVKVAN